MPDAGCRAAVDSRGRQQTRMVHCVHCRALQHVQALQRSTALQDLHSCKSAHGRSTASLCTSCSAHHPSGPTNEGHARRGEALSTPMLAPRHLDPSWIAAFTSGDEAAKQLMMSRLTTDWLHGYPPGVDHCSAIVELCQLAHESAARRQLIESCATDALVAALAAPTQSASAAAATSRFLDAYPPSAGLLTDALNTALATCSRSTALLDGLDRLSILSAPSRMHVFPVVLEDRITSLFNGAAGFEEVTLGFADIGRLRAMLEVSPYKAVVDAAFAA